MNYVLKITFQSKVVEGKKVREDDLYAHLDDTFQGHKDNI